MDNTFDQIAKASARVSHVVGEYRRAVDAMNAAAAKATDAIDALRALLDATGCKHTVAIQVLGGSRSCVDCGADLPPPADQARAIVTAFDAGAGEMTVAVKPFRVDPDDVREAADALAAHDAGLMRGFAARDSADFIDGWRSDVLPEQAGVYARRYPVASHGEDAVFFCWFDGSRFSIGFTSPRAAHDAGRTSGAGEPHLPWRYLFADERRTIDAAGGF